MLQRRDVVVALCSVALCSVAVGCSEAPERVRPATSAGAGTLSADASVPPPDPGARAYSIDTLPRDLLGYWDLGERRGDCTSAEDYISYFGDGTAEAIRVDSNACYPEERGIFITPATYALTGRTLTFTTPTSSTRSAVAIGERAGVRALCRAVLVPSEPLHWQSVVESEAQDGEAVFLRDRAQVDLFFDKPVPADAAADGTLELRYEITIHDERASIIDRDRRFSATLTPLSWHAGPSPDEPSMVQIDVRGDLGSVIDEVVVSSTVGDVLAFTRDGFTLSFDPEQADHLASQRCVPALDAPPAELRR
jgi:hypothetical protein